MNSDNGDVLDGMQRSRRIISLLVLTVFYAIAFLDRQILTLMIDPIRKDLGVSDFDMSLLQGAVFVIFYAVCGIPIGWAVDRFPRNLIIFVGVAVWSVSTAMCGLGKAYWQLLLARCGVGAGEASLLPSVYSMLSDLYPKERLAGAMAVFSSGAVIGGAISFAFGGFLISLATKSQLGYLPILGVVKPWQLVFIATGLLGLALSSLAILVHEPRRVVVSRVAGGRDDHRSLLQTLASRRPFYACHFIGFGLFALLALGYMVWLPTYLMRTFHWPVVRVGETLGVMSLVGGLVGTLGGGYVVDQLVRRGVRDAHFYFALVCVLACGAAGSCTVLARNSDISEIVDLITITVHRALRGL